MIKVITLKETYYCKKLILCSGPIGNALILLRSFKNINYLRFKDDNPRMIFGLNLGVINANNNVTPYVGGSLYWKLSFKKNK